MPTLKKSVFIWLFCLVVFFNLPWHLYTDQWFTEQFPEQGQFSVSADLCQRLPTDEVIVGTNLYLSENEAILQTSFHLIPQVLLSCLWSKHPRGLRALQEETFHPNKLLPHKDRRERTPDVQKELGVDLRIKKDDEYGLWNRALSNVISICWVTNPILVWFFLQSEFNGKVFQSENTGPLKNAVLCVNNHLPPNKTLFVYEIEALHFDQLINKWLLLRICNPDGKP